MNDFFSTCDIYMQGGNVPTIKQVQIQCKYSIQKPWCFGTFNFRKSWDKKIIWMWASQRGVENTIWGKVVASPSPGRGESCESEVARGSS